jgi:carbon-monoxide dehydrogenase small subunit
MKLSFTLNGRPVSAECPPERRLLDLLREDLHLTGTKEGCGEGECGACTVLLEGRAVNACLIMAAQVEGLSLLTIEGLAEGGELDPLQQAFVDKMAVQCGFCSPGMIMSAKALLLHNPHPSEEKIRQALAGNICRCSGYAQIIAAVQAAADLAERY